METVNIPSPYNRTYPLGEDIYNDPCVLYHGTRSNFCPQIEENGWEINQQPYEIEDVRYICGALEGFRYLRCDGYVALRGCTLGENDRYAEEKAAYFTKYYWGALDYAWNLGGETIFSLLHVIECLTRFVNNPKLMEEHLTTLRRELESTHPVLPKYLQIQNALTLLTEGNLILELTERLPQLEQKYRRLLMHHEGSYPVIYTIQSDKSWFLPNRPPTDILAGVSIPNTSIIARINYPNSLATFPSLKGCEPLQWNMEPFLAYLRGFQDDPNFKDFIEYYEELGYEIRTT